MTNIEKKSLQHVSDILKSFDTYPIYSALSDAMKEAGIENSVSNKIIDKYCDAINEQSKKLYTAKDWINTIISDIS